jgi:succinate dehydrogenase / fumarate reductase flavoprotein subunit
VNGSKVELSHRPVITERLTTEEDGGISLAQIAPKVRTF